MATVREFVRDAYQLISAHSPTVTLYGDDENVGIRILNELLNSYAGNGLMLTIAKTETVPIIAGQQYVTVGAATIVPTPDIPAGRLANLDSAWIILDQVTYPLIDESRNEFFAAYKYEALNGLPRFIIVLPDTDIVRLRIYPAPSQQYDFYIRGKFQLTDVTSNDTMDALPGYYQRYLKFALARDLALYKGRADAWTDKLEARYIECRDDMISTSEVNLAVTGDRESLLNGSWRVKAGI